MTLEQFLDALGETPRDWFIWDLGHIRLGPRCLQCPIEAVPGSFKGLPADQTAAVMCAADNDRQHDPALRAQLLARTGLREPEQ